MLPDNSYKIERKKLRSALRGLRRKLPPEAQLQAAKSAAQTALHQSTFPLGDHIALYMAADGELDTQFLLEELLAAGKSCYLPVLVEETTSLQFRQYQPDAPMMTNFFGLLEPEASAPTIAPEDLTNVFMPLVGFDNKGCRLGMGKGYYDRTFEFLLQNPSIGPVLIGLAHECQRVESLDAAIWDVPLACIITGQNLILAEK